MASVRASFHRCYGREYCGRPDRHPYELFLQLEGIEHRRTAVGRPQSNGIVEMQADLDAFLAEYNHKRPHQGRGMEGRTPATVFKAGLPKQTKKEKIAA